MFTGKLDKIQLQDGVKGRFLFDVLLVVYVSLNDGLKMKIRSLAVYERGSMPEWVQYSWEGR
jgi:hypothetical protein